MLVTVMVTVLAFAISLLLGIVGVLIGARLRGVPVDMTLAYRAIAAPAAAVAGAGVLISALSMEIRHYWQARTFARIERAR